MREYFRFLRFLKVFAELKDGLKMLVNTVMVKDQRD